MVQIALNTVAMRYTTAILQKRISLKIQEDRKMVADRIIAVSSLVVHIVSIFLLCILFYDYFLIVVFLFTLLVKGVGIS